MLAQVKGRAEAGQAEQIEEVEKTVGFLDQRIALINRVVTSRLNYKAQHHEVLGSLTEEYAQFQAQMKPATDRAVAELRQGNAQAGVADEANAPIGRAHV